MNAQARYQLQLPQRPSEAGQDRNKKVALKAEVINWLEKNNLGWSYESVQSQGGRFVNTLTDVLWYLDGHHASLKARSCQLPAEFEMFVGFNVPEKSKHRKREHTNLERGMLNLYSEQLAEITLQPWMSSAKWKPVKEAVVTMSDCLGKYSNYFAHQSDVTKANQSLSHPVREGTDSESFVVPAFAWIKPTFAARYGKLECRLMVLLDFQPLLIKDYAPADAR